MPFDVSCPHCGRNFHLKDELAGKKFRCSDCQEIVTANVAKDPLPPARGSRQQTAAPASRESSQKKNTVASADKATPATRRPAGSSASGSSAAGSSATGSGSGRGRNSTGSSGREPKVARPVRSGKPQQKSEPVYDMTGDDVAYEVDDDYEVEDTGWNDPYEQADPYGAAPAPRSSRGSRSSSSRSRSAKSRRSAAGSGWSLGFNPGRLNIFLAVVGGVLLMIGMMEFSLSRKSNSTPVNVTLAELLQNGPGASIYLTISGIQPVSDEFVYEEQGRVKKYYTKVYIPCRPAGVQGNADVRFVLYSGKAKDDSAVMQLMNQSTHTGMITNSIRRLGTEELQLLRSAAPGSNLSEALIFEVGRSPSGALKYVTFILGGFGLLLAGLALIFVKLA